MPEQKKPFIVIYVEQALLLNASEAQKYKSTGNAINRILDVGAASHHSEYFIINYLMAQGILRKVLDRMESGALYVGFYTHTPADKALHYVRLGRFLNVTPALLSKYPYISGSPHKTRKDTIDDFLRMRPEFKVEQVIFVPSAAAEVWKQLDSDLDLSTTASTQPVPLYVPPPLRPGYTGNSNIHDTAVAPKTNSITTMARAAMERSRINRLHLAFTKAAGTSEDAFAQWNKSRSDGQEARTGVHNRGNKNKALLDS